MPSTTVKFAVVAATILTVIALVSGIVRAARNRELRWSSLIGAGIVFLTFSFVQVIVTYTDSWVQVTDVYRVVTHELPAWGKQTLRTTLLIAALGAFAMFALGLRRRNAQVNLPAVLLLLVAAVSMGSALLHGDIPFRTYSLVYVCLLSACIFAPRGLPIQLGIGAMCVAAGVASGLAMVLRENVAVVSCQAGYKCGILGFNFQGVQDNENALALYIALAVPFVYMAFRGWEAIVMVGYLTGLVLMTGSRSGTLAAIVTVVTLLLLRPDIRNPGATPVRSAALSAVLAIGFAIGVIVPLSASDSTAFTGRVALWELARTSLSNPSNFFYGNGMLGWSHVAESGRIDSSEVYSVHNQWLDVLYSTGVIGFVLFLAAIGILLWQARNGYYLVVGCLLVPYVVLAITERPWTLDTADWLCWVIPGVLLSYPPLRRNAPEGSAIERSGPHRGPVPENSEDKVLT